MELQFQTVTMMLILLLITFLCPMVESQPLLETKPARALDALLQDYAYRAAFTDPTTGVSFNANLTNNLTGIQVSALRLKTGSLFTRGVAAYREFKIPVGVVVQPYVERLVLVYHNLGNWSTFYYALPGYMYLAPVLGLLAYNGSDLSAKNLTELDVRASGEPISMDFGSVRPAPDGSKPMCVWFDLRGQVNFINVVSGNRCFTFRQGHFSIVVESKPKPKPKPKPVPPSAPVPPSLIPPSLIPPAASEVVNAKPDKNRGTSYRFGVVVSYVVGGCVLLLWLAALVLWICVWKERKRMRKMEQEAEGGEPLHMTMIGGVRVPVAMGTRTRPTLETEHAS